MTCIVAVAAPDGTVIMGGDAAGTDERDLSLGIGAETKVWKQGPLLFGACGSFRVSQLLRWHMQIPVPDPDMEPLEYVTGPLIDAMRTTLAERGALSTFLEDATESMTESGLLLGYAGRVFEVWSDFGVGELVHGYASCGCGSLIALGVLAATEHLDVKPKRRVRLALDAAERHSAGVRGPMTILRQSL